MDPTREPRTSLRRSAMVAGTLAIVGLVAVFFVSSSVRTAFGHAISGDYGTLGSDLRESALAGWLLPYALTLIHMIVPFPAEIINLAIGYVHGVGWGLVVGVSAWVLSAVGTYVLGRSAGRPLLVRLTKAETRVRYEELVERGGWEVLVVARLLPVVPYSLVGYIAGATRVPLTRFVWTTTVGSIPLIALMVVLGARAREFSIADPVVWITIGGLAGLVLVSRPMSLWLHRRHMRHADHADAVGGAPTTSSQSR